MWDFINRPEVIAAIGAGIALLLPRQVWEVFPIIRYVLAVFDAAAQAKEAEAKKRQLEALSAAAFEAVHGAEQLKKNGLLDNQSAKAYAMNFIKSNFDVDDGTAELLVEAAVREMNALR